jgi:spore cortex formation protein SpoVR/YcgB (stage V sporulation)
LGAWGTGVFDNDTACDFAFTVREGGGIDILTEVIDRVSSIGNDYVETRDAEECLAAADIIARLRGSPGEQTAYTAEIDSWIANSKVTISDELVEKAKRSVARILVEPSELLELWGESREFDDWKRRVEEVIRRL